MTESFDDEGRHKVRLPVQVRFHGPSHSVDAEPAHSHVSHEWQPQMRCVGEQDRDPEPRELRKVAIVEQQHVNEIV